MTCEKCYLHYSQKCNEGIDNCLAYKKHIAGKEIYEKRHIYCNKKFFSVSKTGIIKNDVCNKKMSCKVDGKLKTITLKSIDHIIETKNYYIVIGWVKHFEDQTGFLLENNSMITNFYELEHAVKIKKGTLDRLGGTFLNME